MSSSREARDFSSPQPERQEPPGEKKKSWLRRNIWRIYAVVLVALIIASAALSVSLMSHGSQSQKNCYAGTMICLDAKSSGVFFSYSQPHQTYLEGFVNASSPNYVSKGMLSVYPLNSTLNFERYVFYVDYLLVLPLSSSVNYSQNLLVDSPSISHPLNLILNLTNAQNTAQEIVDKQGMKGNVTFDVNLEVFFEPPLSSNQTLALNTTVGQMGFNSAQGDWISFTSLGFEYYPILVIN